MEFGKFIAVKIGRIKNFVAYTFAIAFLLLKVAGLHVFTHDQDNVEHCEVCDLVSISNFTPLVNDVAESPIIGEVCFYADVVISRYSFTYSKTTHITCLFSRPPPSSLV